MKLEDLFYQIAIVERLRWDPSRKINKVTADSRSVEKGDVFVACPGSRMDGHDFIGQAVYAGAAVIVYDRLTDVTIPKTVTMVKVPDSRKCLTRLLKRYHDEPDRKLKIIGITGTNGKTTASYLLYNLLKQKAPCGYIGTLWYEYAGQKITALNTTPGPEILFPLLAQMAEAGVEFCFLEVSSHALEQCRVYGIEFELALFTQLTQDHLDYHKTMERYYQSKRLLFMQDPAPRKMLINRDCPYGKRLLDENLSARSYSAGRLADYSAEGVECSFTGSRFDFLAGRKRISFSVKLPMPHNVSNAVAVLGVLDLLGFPPEGFVPLFADLPGVPGRLELVPLEEPYQVFVDYAHTPDACEHVLAEARRLRPKRILTLLGCGGDRDQEKRPLMAAVAANYSDVLIMTSDNPRSEDPEHILADMRAGIEVAEGDRLKVLEILDRREAIEKLLSMAEPDDVLFILGKGHEDYQILGDIKIPFDDRLTVREVLKKKSRVFFS